MPAPYDYSISGTQSPLEAFMGAAQMGAAFAKQKAQAEQAQLVNKEFQGLLAIKNPTANDYMRVASVMPADQANSLRASWEGISKEQQMQQAQFAGQVMATISANRVDLATKMLNDRAAAERNSGREDQAKSYETYAQLTELNPIAAQKTIGIMLAGIPDGAKVLESITKTSEMDADAAFRNAMQGVTTVEQMYEKIPVLATMGEKGLEIANKMLTQQRLGEQAREAGITAEQQRGREQEQATQAAGMLRVLFPSAVSVGGGDQAAGFSTVGDMIRVDEAAVGNIIKTGGYQITEAQRSTLGLSQETEGLIRALAQTDPKAAGKVMMNIVNQKIKRDLTPAKSEKLPSSAQEFALASGLTPGTPEFQRGYTQHLRQQKAGQDIKISLTPMEKAAGTEAGKLFDAWYDSATTGNQQLRDMDIYERSIAKAITGPFANTRMKATQIASMLGFGGEDAVSSTRELIQGLSEMTLGARGMLKGQGAITDREQELLARARGGDIDMTAPELKTLFKAIRRGVTAKTERDTRMLKRAADRGSDIAKMYLEEIEIGRYVPGAAPTAPGAPAAAASVIPPSSQVESLLKKHGGK